LLVADLLFDLPLRHPLSYAVPEGLALAPGQRVTAPVQGRARVGLVLALRDADASGLAAVATALEPAPVLSPVMLELGRWAAAESLSAPGSTLAALLPPAPRRATVESVAPPPMPAPGAAPLPPELWADLGRDARLAELAARADGAVLVIAPDIDSAARWAERLDGARLDSGAPDPARRAAWFGAGRGRPRVVVGTRSALLVPLPPPATLALLDEADTAHKPPGAPRLHSRELLVERARREGSRLVLLAGAPAAETWHHTRTGDFHLAEAPAPEQDWPEIVAADTRGILRNHPLTLPLTRAIEEAGRRGGRVALVVSRGSAALGCDECGEVLRCPDCGVALGVGRAGEPLGCRICGRREAAPSACPRCGGHRLSPFGWSPERVEASVRKRFPTLTVARAGSRETGAHVVIGGAGVLRGLEPGGLSAVGFVALDGLLRVPDFRAGERAFQSLWAAAEVVGGTGRVIVQTLHPEHYAIQAVRQHARRLFYEPELQFRAELGYPPYRRLCLLDVRGKTEEGARALIAECTAALHGIAGIRTYPATPRGTPAARRPWWRILVKGPADLPRLLEEPLRPLLERRRRSPGVVEIEIDPISL
jgi:primosomal protein N' (replication factor Y)